MAKWQRGNGGFDKGLPKCGKVAKLLFWHMPTYAIDPFERKKVGIEDFPLHYV